MSLFQNLGLLPDKLIDNVGQVGDDEEGDHSEGEIRRFLRCSVEYHSQLLQNFNQCSCGLRSAKHFSPLNVNPIYHTIAEFE